MRQTARVRDKDKPQQRRRCHNCAKTYTVHKPWQRFCSAKCRREWGRNDSAYGRLKEKLEKFIEARARFHADRVLAEFMERIRPGALRSEKP